MCMTMPTTSDVQDELEQPGRISVSLDYRARAAILQLPLEEQKAIHAGIAMLARYGLSDRRVRRVHGLSIGDERGPVYEMRAPGATDLRIFFTVSEHEGKTVFSVTDVLHRRALQNIARGS